jgi:quinol monooxygenase YgiN
MHGPRVPEISQMPLTIVANIRAKAGQEDLVLAELERLVEPTRHERGCIQYDLHRNNDHAGHFLFFENWETRELWQAHMASAHIARYREATDGAIDDFSIDEMTRTV